MRRFGFAVLSVAAAGLACAFIPSATIIALLIALLGLALGILCLIFDRGFNGLALIGTIMASAAVSLAIIMAFVFST